MIWYRSDHQNAAHRHTNTVQWHSGTVPEHSKEIRIIFLTIFVYALLRFPICVWCSDVDRNSLRSELIDLLSWANADFGVRWQWKRSDGSRGIDIRDIQPKYMLFLTEYRFNQKHKVFDLTLSIVYFYVSLRYGMDRSLFGGLHKWHLRKYVYIFCRWFAAVRSAQRRTLIPRARPIHSVHWNCTRAHLLVVWR